MNTVEETTTTNNNNNNEITEVKPVITLDKLPVVATVTAPWVDRFAGLEDCDWEYEVEE